MSDKIATQYEAATLLRLRSQSGWYVGDMRALVALREFAAEVRAEAARDVAKALQFSPGADECAAQVRARTAA